MNYVLNLLTNYLSVFNHFVGLALKELIIIHQIFVKKTGNKINAIYRIQTLLSRKEKKALVNTFVYSTFNCCSLILNFSTGKTTSKIEKIQELCLKSFYNNTTETYGNLLIKTRKDKDPNYMKEIFYLSPHEAHKKYD